MAVSFESVSVGPKGNGSTVIDKPSGLAVGDLMIAQVYKSAPDDFDDIVPPSGWGVIDKIADPTSGNLLLAAFYKYAVSGDVSAESFTFTTSFQERTIEGAIYRISGAEIFPSKFQNTKNAVSNNEALSLALTGLTPSFPNSLLLIMATRNVGNGAPTFSNYSITNNNPTWTSRVSTSDGNSSAMGGATAILPQTINTGAGNVDISNGVSTTHRCAIFLCIPPQKSLEVNKKSFNLLAKGAVFVTGFLLLAEKLRLLFSGKIVGIVKTGKLFSWTKRSVNREGWTKKPKP